MICFIRITGAVAIVNGVGMEAIEGLRFLASLPLAGTGRTEGGEKTQPFNRFHSRLFTHALRRLGMNLFLFLLHCSTWCVHQFRLTYCNETYDFPRLVLLLRINFPGKPISIQLPPDKTSMGDWIHLLRLRGKPGKGKPPGIPKKPYDLYIT